MKKVLFTHDDLDGAGCRILYEIAHNESGYVKGKDYTVVNCSNNNVNDKVKEAIDDKVVDEDTDVSFGDISPSLEILEELMKVTKEKVHIWDHHRTNFPCTSVVPWAVIIPENELGKMECGTSLMYQYFCMAELRNVYYDKSVFITSKLISLFVDTVRSYDTFEFKETGNMLAKRLQTLFFMLGMETFCSKFVSRLTDGSEMMISSSEDEFIDAKLEAEKRVIDSITIKDIMDVNVRGYRTAFLMFPAGANISDLAYKFLQNHPEFEMFASFSLSNGGEFSFRTQKEDLDVGAVIASPIGGGGHPKASGAPVQQYIKDMLFNELVANMNGIYDKK